MISYGTGAIMSVPAHDERDFEFASTFGLPIVPVVDPPEPQDQTLVREGKKCFTGEGTAINSGQFDGLSTAEFKQRMTQWLTDQGLGHDVGTGSNSP